MSELDALFDSLRDVPKQGLPPIEQWHPSHSGQIDIRIDATGRWFHEGGEIRRAELVKLFASILRREQEQHYLVTPVEKLAIQVDDAPLLIVESTLDTSGDHRVVVMRSNLDDVFELTDPRDFTLSDGIPYIHVRRGLLAKVSRPVYYQWAEWAECRLDENQANSLQLASAGRWFNLGAV